MNVVVLYRLLSFKFEAFISKAFPFQRLLACFWWNNVNLGAKGRRGWKELGPLLLLIISGCWQTLLATLLSVSWALMLNMALAPSWVNVGHLLKRKCAHSPLNLPILSATRVPITLTTVQVPDLALTHTKHITVQAKIFTVYHSGLFTLFLLYKAACTVFHETHPTKTEL